MARRIQIKNVRRSEIDVNLLAYVYFLEGKRLVQERREREAKAKTKRREGAAHSKEPRERQQ